MLTIAAVVLRSCRCLWFCAGALILFLTGLWVRDVFFPCVFSCCYGLTLWENCGISSGGCVELYNKAETFSNQYIQTSMWKEVYIKLPHTKYDARIKHFKNISTVINFRFRNWFHVRWVQYHHSMARPQVADRGDGLQVWRVAANILNKQ
jgi:hypothetical protein